LFRFLAPKKFSVKEKTQSPEIIGIFQTMSQPSTRRDTYLVMVIKSLGALQRPNQHVSTQAIKNYMRSNLFEDGKEVHAPSFRKAMATAEQKGYVRQVENTMSFQVTPEGRAVLKDKTKAKERKKKATTKKTDKPTSTSQRSSARKAATGAKSSDKVAAPKRKRASSTTKKSASRSGSKGPSTKKRSAASKIKSKRSKQQTVKQSKSKSKPMPKPRAKPLSFQARLRVTKDLYLSQAEDRTAACEKCLQAFFRQYKSVVTHLLFVQDNNNNNSSGSSSKPMDTSSLETKAIDGKFRFRLKSDSTIWSSGSFAESKDGSPKGNSSSSQNKCRQICQELRVFEQEHADTLTEFFGKSEMWTMRADGNSFSMVAGDHLMTSCDTDCQQDQDQEEEDGAGSGNDDDDDDNHEGDEGETTESEGEQDKKKIAPSPDASSSSSVNVVIDAPAPPATTIVTLPMIIDATNNLTPPVVVSVVPDTTPPSAPAVASTIPPV
jgi:hypothetical protein